MPWSDGDWVSPTNLNNKTASATSVTGYSTNTLNPESGNTLSVGSGYVTLLPGSATAPTCHFTSEASLGFYRSTASQVALSYGDFRLPNLGAIKARNSGDTGNLNVLNSTAGNNVQFGGPGIKEAQITNGTDTLQFQGGGHLRPAVDGSQDLGSSSKEYRTVFADTFQSASTAPLSITTQADFNDMNAYEMRLVFTASGLSLGWSSGDSLYDIGSATSAAQPTS
jgi:hypothetical protein